MCIGQMAMKFVLQGPRVASVLPNITNIPQLDEFAATSETHDIPQEFIDQLYELFDENFYVERSPSEEEASVSG